MITDHTFISNPFNQTFCWRCGREGAGYQDKVNHKYTVDPQPSCNKKILPFSDIKALEEFAEPYVKSIINDMQGGDYSPLRSGEWRYASGDTDSNGNFADEKSNDRNATSRKV